jgi:polyphosphate kinase
VRDPKLIHHLRHDVLEAYLADEVKARHMHSSGIYSRSAHRSAQSAVNSQHLFLDRTASASIR